MTLHVRTATIHDVGHTARVLADAFADNPWTRWTVASDDHTDRIRGLHVAFLTTLAIPYGLVHVTEIDGVIAGAATWIRTDEPAPPDVWATLPGHSDPVRMRSAAKPAAPAPAKRPAAARPGPVRRRSD